MLNSKDVKIAYSSIPTQIIDDVLYVTSKNGKTIELPLYMDWCSYDPSFGDYFNELNFWDNAYDGLLTFGIGDKYGYIDIRTGKVACQPKWNWVSLFSKDGYAIVNKGCEPFTNEDVIAYELAPRTGLFGLIDRDFNMVLPFEYDWIKWDVSSCIHKAGSRYCNISTYGSACVKHFNLNADQPLENEWFIVNQGWSQGIVNRNNEVVIPIEPGRLYILSRKCILHRGYSLVLYAGDEEIKLDKVYVCMSHFDDRAYLIVKKSRKYAVVRDDGTFATNFAFSFQQAKQFVDIQFANRTIIGKPWW